MIRSRAIAIPPAATSTSASWRERCSVPIATVSSRSSVRSIPPIGRAHHLSGHTTMTTELSAAEYQQECRAALSAEQARSLADTNNWSHVDKPQTHRDWDALYQELTPLMRRLPPSAPEIEAIMARHYGIVSRFYAPSKQAYIGMSLFYAENDDMRRFHNAYDPNMVAFLAQAMPLYARDHL
jgi:hypothetical protein